MPSYRIRIFDAHTGKADTRVVQSASAAEATQSVTATGAQVLSVTKTWAVLGRRSGKTDIGLFCEELATLLRAGLTVVESLDALGAHEDSEVAPLYRELTEEIKQGRTLSFALSNHQTIFPPVLVASIRSAERTGSVGEALAQYGKFHLVMQEVRRKLVSAAVYPGLVIGFGGLVALFLLFFVIPRFASVYTGLGRNPSMMSSVLLAVSQHMAQYRTAWLVGLGLVFAMVITLARTGVLKQAVIALATRIGSVQRWLRLFQMAEVYRSLSVLLKGGFNLVESLRLCMDTPVEVAMRNALQRVAHQVAEGSSLSQALQTQGIADVVALRLLASGERSGEMSAVLETIADDHTRRVERRLERAMRLAEPLIMILVGAMVGTLVLLMYMPIFDLAGAIS